MRRSLLTTAVAAALAQTLNAPEPELVLRTEQVTLDKVRVIPVKPGHPREPGPGRFDIDAKQGVCYVREADWPKLQQVLIKKRNSATTIEIEGDHEPT